MPSPSLNAVDAEIGPIVLWLRHAAGLTQAEVCVAMQAAGHETWSQMLVSVLERGRRRLSVSEFLDLTSILGADPAEVLGWLRSP